MRTAVLFGLVFIGRAIGTLSADTRVDINNLSYFVAATICVILDLVEAIDNHNRGA